MITEKWSNSYKYECLCHPGIEGCTHLECKKSCQTKRAYIQQSWIHVHMNFNNTISPYILSFPSHTCLSLSSDAPLPSMFLQQQSPNGAPAQFHTFNNKPNRWSSLLHWTKALSTTHAWTSMTMTCGKCKIAHISSTGNISPEHSENCWDESHHLRADIWPSWVRT